MSTSLWGLRRTAALIATLLTGCGGSAYQTADQTYSPERPPSVQAPNARMPAHYQDDTSITDRVHAAVTAVPGIHSDRLQVMTKDGVVSLLGSASNDVAARNAVQAARQVTGVRSVEYDIQVQGQ